MKPFRIIARILALFTVIATSCAKEIKENENYNNSHKIFAKVTLPQGTKHTYSENDPSSMDSGRKSTWSSGDYFYALTGNGDCLRFDLESGVGETSATFSADPGEAAAGLQRGLESLWGAADKGAYTAF